MTTDSQLPADYHNESSGSDTGHFIPSRDEMNLAEFPLAVLSTRANPRVKTLEFHDTIRGRNGDDVKRQWIITGADRFGLPTASDDEVLLGLLKLTAQEGFSSQKVYFTRYELLKILQWTTEGRSYTRLQNALDRLSGVRIKASNAFYDNEKKAYSTRNFGILDGYEINDGRDTQPRPSFFTWSEVLFKSFQDGFIKKLDLNFLLGLKSAVTKRLYRYLDKHFWYRKTVKMNVFLLAHEKIGVSRNYKYLSSIRQQLDPALDELQERGFLSGYEYQGKGKNAELVVHAPAGTGKRVQSKVVTEVGQTNDKGKSSSNGGNLNQKISGLLLERGIRSSQLDRLIGRCREDDLRRIEEIIDYYDYLVRANSKLISKSPVGFLYRAIERFEQFVLPREQKKTQKKQIEKGRPLEQNAQDQQYEEYKIWRTEELKRVHSEVDSSLVQKIEVEAREELGKIQDRISETRFNESVQHLVQEKIATLFAIQSFEEWKSKGRKPVSVH